MLIWLWYAMMANEEVNVLTLKMDDLEYSLSYKEIVTKPSVVWYVSRAIPLEAQIRCKDPPYCKYLDSSLGSKGPMSTISISIYIYIYTYNGKLVVSVASDSMGDPNPFHLLGIHGFQKFTRKKNMNHLSWEQLMVHGKYVVFLSLAAWFICSHDGLPI